MESQASITPIESSSKAMQQVLARQQAAFMNEGPVSLEVRLDRLKRGYRLIGENKDAIIQACNKDFGNRSFHQSQMAEIMAVMGSFEHCMKHVKKWMKKEKRAVEFPLNLMGAKARVEYVPKGVVGNLGTWNFPVYTSISPVAGIFAAGNRAMVKLSELTPATSDLLKTLIAKYFSEEELVGVTGGAEVGAEFSAMPFDHIIFTGGGNIGKHILQAASANLTPCTLELGGKSPVIISRSYDLKKAAERIMTGKALNCGQVCLSPDYVFVPKEKEAEFIQYAVEFFSELFPTMLNNPDYTSIINKRHHDRIITMINDAKAHGATVTTINPANEDFTQQAEGINKIPMTLISNYSEDMLIAQQEIFGACLGIKTYDNLNDCIHFINAHPRPLGLYYFGNDKAEERTVLDRTISGGTVINDVMAHTSCENLPFGGVGASGMGHYHGHDGFKTFSHARAIYTQSKFELIKLAGLLPPYTDKAQQQLDKLCKIKH